MTEQERQLIQGLVTRIQNAPPPQIDRDADELIRRSITRPDALYLLVQTVLIQDMALNQAKAQIDQLKQQSQTPAQPAAQSGFLPNEPIVRPTRSADWGYDTHVQQSAAPPPPQSSAIGGFLRSAATTAAGVIAGETAFSALSSIFGHHATGYFGGSGFLSGAPVSPGSETIINNYYDDDRNDRDNGGDDTQNIDDPSDYDDNSSNDDGSVDV